MLPFGLNIRSLLTHTTWYRLAIMSEVEFFTYFVIQRLELNELTYDKTENSRNENKKKGSEAWFIYFDSFITSGGSVSG